MSKWWKLPKTWALAQPNSNACLMMNPPKILLNLNVNFLSCLFFLTQQHILFEFWNVYVPVSVLRLANNQVFQLGVFKPDRVGRLYPGWWKESPLFLLHVLRFICTFFYLALKDMALWSMVFRKKSWMIFCERKIHQVMSFWTFCVPAHLPGVGLWRGSPEKSDTSCSRKSWERSLKVAISTWSYSALQAWRASPPPRRPPQEGWWTHCPCSEGPVPPGQRWPLCTWQWKIPN